MAVKSQPDEYHALTPYLRIRGASEAIDFYSRVFGAKEIMRMSGADGKSVMHAELKIGDSVVMVSDPIEGESVEKGSNFGLLIYVDDVDSVFNTATGAGATVKAKIETMFYGDRMGVVVDPYGHEWMIATHVEDISEEEMQKRMKAQSENVVGASD